MGTPKRPRRPRAYNETHLMTNAEVAVSVTTHIDLEHEEGIELTVADTRDGRREVEIVLYEGEAETLMIKLERALANLKARR